MDCYEFGKLLVYQIAFIYCHILIILYRNNSFGDGGNSAVIFNS